MNDNKLLDYLPLTIEQILDPSFNDSKQGLLLRYIKGVGGIENIKKKDMDKMLERFGIENLEYKDFFEYYIISMENEKEKRDRKTNNIIMRWTWVVGIATVIQVAIVIYDLFKSS